MGYATKVCEAKILENKSEVPNPKCRRDIPTHIPTANGMQNVSTPNTNAFEMFFFRFSKSISRPARNMM
jgi:hypothetical protein